MNNASSVMGNDVTRKHRRGAPAFFRGIPGSVWQSALSRRPSQP
jgi:hypothetical protein